MLKHLEANHTYPLNRPKVPSHPCCNSRSSPIYPYALERKQKGPAHIQRSPVSASLLEMRDPFPTWSKKNSRGSRRISRGGPLHRKGDRYSRSGHHSKSPPDVSVHFRGTCFPALPRLSRRGSTHTTVARGTALWECLLGKPRGKAWRENHRSLHTLDGAGVQPRWIQGILRVDGVGMVRLLYLLI